MTTNNPRTGADAVGSYRDPNRGSSSIMPWIIGGIVLLALLLMALWMFGAFSRDDEPELRTTTDEPNTTLTTPADAGTTE